MKAYILTEADLDRLLLRIDRNPLHGHDGGSSDAAVNDPIQQKAHEDAHAFYNYQVRKWLDEVKK